MRLTPLFAAFLLCASLHAQDTIEYTLCGLDFRPIGMHQNLPANAIYRNTKATAEARAADVVKRLTFDEKLTLTGGLKTFYYPGVERLGLAPVYFADATQGVHEKDICTKVLKTTAFPSGQALAATWDRQMAHDYAQAISEETRAWGVEVLLGPGLNLYRNAEGGRNFEYFGEDPFLASQIGVHYVKGMQANGTIATVKHFLGNEQEFYRHIADVKIGERALRELYLAPYKAAIQQGGVLAVMTGNNLVNGYPGAADMPLSKGVLRNEYGYKGIIMSDWANSLYWKNRLDLELTSGHSLLMADNALFAKWVNNQVTLHPESKAAIEKQLGMMVQENLYSFFKSGYYDRPYRDPALVSKIESHNAVALKAAEEAITLLKNQDDVLPIAQGKKIAVVGTDEALTVYGGKGSGAVKGYDHVDFMAGLKAVYGDNVVRATDDAAVKSADVVLLFVNKPASEGKDIPFENPAIDEAVEKYASMNSNVVVIISAGNGLPMPWLSQVKGVVFGYFLGQQRGTAMANVLSGKVSPSGKLPFTIEKTFKDSPAFDYNKMEDGTYAWGGGKGDSAKFQQNGGKNIPVVYREGIYIGYRWYEKKQIPVQFPFGFGLSYTKFAYSDFKVSGKPTASAPATVSFTVKNTGTREGAEIAQIYIHSNAGPVDRPVKALKGFERVDLKAGESKIVSMPITVQDLAYWSEGKHGWMSDRGEYDVLVGSSSQDIRGRVSLQY
ncbi:MAG: glycoside hydrolase family 3 C-terminal domain-containing protein [Acidobacteria bacterium]|nr:glycoside hydrolase family 3 C-terminal domain-containing protein [Acidobacteriota bacterium]